MESAPGTACEAENKVRQGGTPPLAEGGRNRGAGDWAIPPSFYKTEVWSVRRRARATEPAAATTTRTLALPELPPAAWDIELDG